MRWTLAARETSAACRRTAKSCGSDAPMPASSLREDAQATVSNKHGHRGEREVSRKTIARGMPGRSGVTVVTMLVCLFFTHEAAGASRARHSLRPLNFRRREILGRTRAESRGENAGVHLEGSVIARSESDEAIHSLFTGDNGLLGGACRGAPARTQPKAPPGGGDRARPWCPVALTHQNAPAPGLSFRGFEVTRPPERCGGYAVRPARSGRSPPCNDTE